MQLVNLPQEQAKIVLETITKRASPCTIFVLGYSNIKATSDSFTVDNTATDTQYCYVLVVTRSFFKEGASNMANTIFEVSNKTIKATILLHKITDFATKQPHQQRFFDKVLRDGQRLCLDKAAPPYILCNTTPVKKAEDHQPYWHKCVAVAQFNIQAAADSPHLAVELCQIALLNTACVQLALGLIRIGMDYTPNEWGLNYLFQLCGYFTTLPVKIFCNGTPEAIRRYKQLCAPPSMLLHWTKLNASEEDLLWLLDATRQFLVQSQEVAAGYLTQQSNNH